VKKSQLLNVYAGKGEYGLKILGASATGTTFSGGLRTQTFIRLWHAFKIRSRNTIFKLFIKQQIYHIKAKRLMIPPLILNMDRLFSRVLSLSNIRHDIPNIAFTAWV